MRKFNVLKKYDVVSKFDKVDMFGRARGFRRTPSPHATEPALLCNFDEDENSDKPSPFDQTRTAATSIKGRVETEEEKTTNKINVSQYIENKNLEYMELHKSEKKHRSERKRHKEKRHRRKHEKKSRSSQDSLDNRLANVNLKDDTNNFLLTIETGRTFMHDNIDDLSKSMPADIDFDVHQLFNSDDEEYDRRLSDVKRYIPFLQMMIEKHRQMNDLESLKKMECLYEVLTQSKKKLKIETLRRCDDVLEKLYHKVEEALREETNVESLNDDILSTVSSSLRNTRFHQIGNLDATFEVGGMSPISSPTSSPTPLSSPNDSFLSVDDDIDDDAIIEHLESPEDGEIFDALENSNNDTDDNSIQSISRSAIPQSSKRDSDMSIDEEWDMLEEKPSSPKQYTHTWKSIIVTGHDVVTAAKLVGINISKRVASAPKPYTPPPKPVEIKQLESIFPNNENYDSFEASLNDTNPRSESQLNVPENGFQSPDYKLFFDERFNTPKKPEEPPQPVPPPAIQPVVAPPKLNDVPLISMAHLEDLIKNQSVILKDGLQQQQQTKDEKDPEKEKKAAKAQEFETVTPIRRKQTGNVKIVPVTLKLDSFITGAKDRSPSPEAPVDPRIRARMLKEKNVDPRLAKENAAIPPRPPVGDLYFLRDFNIKPITLSNPIHTTSVSPTTDYTPAGSGNQWNYGSNIHMPATLNPYGMPRDTNMHTNSWEMNLTINSNLNPNMNINKHLNRNPNMAENYGCGNNIKPPMRHAASNSAYDPQMNYSQHPQHLLRQQNLHCSAPLDNFNTSSIQYGHQNPPSWNKPGDAIKNVRTVLNRDPRSINNMKDVHRLEWNREGQTTRLPERERHNDWDNRNPFSRDPQMRLEPLVLSPNQVTAVAEDTSVVRDQTTAKDQNTTKESTTSKYSTITKDVTAIKDLTTTKDSTKKKLTNSKDSTATRNSTTKKDIRSTAKEKPKTVDKEKESKKADAKHLHKSSKSSSKSNSRNMKEKERSKSKEKTPNSESRRRQEVEKGDEPQSLLESLNGVVDRKAAAGEQVLQKFKIPKLTKPGPVSSPILSTSTDAKSYRYEDSKSSSKIDYSKSRDRGDRNLQSKASSRTDKAKDEEKERDKEKGKENKDTKKAKKQKEVIESAKTKDQKANISSEAEKSRLKTIEDLKNFINMILMQESGRKLLKNEKIYEKFKKVFENEELSECRQLVESDSDSSDSGKSERVTKKKKRSKKKRRVLESDSSDAEEGSLAKRIEKVEPPINEEKEAEEPKVRRKLKKRPGAAKEPEEDTDKESEKETKEVTNKVEGKDTETKNEKLKDLKEQPELIKDGVTKEFNKSLITEPTAPKARVKPRRKNALERLQEDLKDYISAGFITAGQRSCRLAKEQQEVANNTAGPNTSNLANEIYKKSPEIDEQVKFKTKQNAGSKYAKKTVSKELGSNSQTEEDQPLAVRKEPVKKKKMLGPKSKRQARDLALEPYILLQRADTLPLRKLAKANESPTVHRFKTEITKRKRARSIAAERRRITPSSDKKDKVQTIDDERLASDIAFASCVASMKADEMNKAVQESFEKSGEAEETVKDFQPTDKVGEKFPLKKKKKKSTWRLGIVSIANKRKKQLHAQAKQADTLHLEETAIRRSSLQVVEDHELAKQIHCTNTTPSAEAEPDHTEKQEHNDSQTTNEILTVVRQEINPEDLDRIVGKEDSIIELDSPGDSNLKIVDDSINNEVLRNSSDVNQLIDYVCYGQEKAKCLHCFFTGKGIVHHYKTVHPEREVSVSRLKALEAKSAVQEHNDNDFEKTCLVPTNKKDYHFSCRFCFYKIKGRKEESMESAYEHVTSHTGEYRFKCIECNHQATTRSAIKMHYYKNCMKLGRTIREAVVEQKAPQENRLYGYMCSLCNFVQLRMNNVEDHIKTWHVREPSSKIVKINMSLDSPSGNVVDGPGISEKLVEISLLDTLPNDLNAEVERKEAEKEARKSNLSAFVCPLEFEKKNEEIELVRKKMQEVGEKIGLKTQKHEAQKGFSIIDKLKDRMDTTEEPQTAERNFRGDLDSPESNLRIVESLNEESDNLLCADSLFNADISDSWEALDVNEQDKSSKLKGPIDVKNEPQEDEASDSEDISLRYEYDSSSENEDATDVNDLLKETTDIRNQSNDSMVTTIQRLAAQIQNSKPLESAGAEMAADDAANSDRCFSKKEIPKAPDVLPISSFKRKALSGTQKQQLVQEVQSSEPNMKGSSPPKLFLRARRFSGDMLSVPEPPSKTAEPSPVVVPSTDNTNIETSEPTTSNIATTDSDFCLEISNITSLAASNEKETPAMRDIPKPVKASNMKLSGFSVLKKNGSLILKREKNSPAHILSNQTITVINPNSQETVKLIPVSITPTSAISQSNHLPIMSATTLKNFIDSKKVCIAASSLPNVIPTKSAILTPIPITKATIIGSITKTAILTPVTIAPNFSINGAIQNCGYTPIKPNSLPSTKAGTITSVKPGTVTLSKPSTIVTSATSPNRKRMKLLSRNTVLKKNEQGPQCAIKMKIVPAYNEMMKPERLRQLYKCMGRECPYTTDYVDNFRRHFNKHFTSYNVNRIGLVPFDFKKCAYCNMSVGDWFQMEKHYEEKHAYCEFQCNYCFYRALTQAYVEIHQANVHPEKSVVVLQASFTNHPRPHVEINRVERVKPFVCQNDCNKYFFVPEAFLAHLNLKHAALSVFSCHLCKVTSCTPDQLIEHYKKHGILKYQCLYCNHGTETMTEMHKHLSSNHYNKKPVCLERILPPSPTKTESAIEQLLLRNAEEQYTLVSKVIGVSDKMPANSELDASRDAKALVQVKPLSEKAESRNYAISVEPTRSNSPPTIHIISTESKVSSDDALKKTKQNLKYKQQEPQKAVESAVDAPGIFQDLGTEDEFINMNLLDNPEFLKTHDATPKKTTLLDDEDSDIEIIKHYGMSESRGASVISDSSTTPDKTPKDLHLLSVADNSDISNEASSFDAPSPSKTNGFLTLGDIRHTGFTGMDLYKCGTLNCNFSAPNSVILRNHIQESCLVNVATSFNNVVNLQCSHCLKYFQKIPFFIEHLEIHGLKRFCCGICGKRYALQSQAVMHVYMKHKVKRYKLFHADPKKRSAGGLFVLQPIDKEKSKIPTPKFVEKESAKFVESNTLAFSPNRINLLPSNSSIDGWGMTLLNRQTKTIKRNLEKLNPDAGGPENSKSESPSKQIISPISSGKSLLNTSGSVVLGSEDDTHENNKDPNDDDVPEIVSEGSSSGQTKTLIVLICKHCKKEFKSKRGFKMHVRRQHLRQYKFLCPLCDRSANLEFHIQQHIYSKHPNRLVKPMPNPSSTSKDADITDEFWVKEYQVPLGKEERGQKRKANFEEVAEKRLKANVIDDKFVCVQCNFVSVTRQAHFSHLNTHKLLYKCAYCSYTDMLKNDVIKHSKSDHPQFSPKVEEIPITRNSNKKFNYECSYCNVRCKTHFAMKKHWTRTHKDPKPKKGAKWKIGLFKYNTLVHSDSGAVKMVTSPPGNHHRVCHSHLPLKCNPADPIQISEDYRCPECRFVAKTYEIMYRHINKHIKLYKCKYCEQSFCETRQMRLHAEQVHPGGEPKIETVKNYVEQLDDLLSRITRGAGFELESSEYESVVKESIPGPVVPARPFPKKLESVAKKSTNPLPRYPPGVKFSNEDAKVGGISHYGVPRASIDMGSISTYMVVGGHRMPVSCLTLAQHLDIDPRVIIVDIMKRLKIK
ncbi:uncharacterized protein LOC117174153 [Belonocnema kinseyi]|uniref:uncharacterized protein LOC117174153 n=1 Tax=Belonocnema kinseyi TaxID=2817044 RepID=UPI00143D9E1E|nr:uncharacterized protein LOC117174153 [Belonocnema kinseyi]XP_033218860.1 uncharacterized protein LOC117174153 [Belonocnema kinseyi]XP_033218861.1 uncharacterized protein LOC117174153 [Belonocnema kinseyi]